MALHVPIPIFGDHEIRRHATYASGIKSLSTPPPDVPHSYIPPFPFWNYLFWVYSFWGFSVGLFSLFYNFFQEGVMPQSYTTWMYVAHTMACCYGEVVTIIAFL